MEGTTLRLSFGGADARQAGMCAQELRKQILDKLPPGVNITLQQHNPEAMQFPGEFMVIEFAGAVLVHTILKVIEQYRRPRGVILRIDLGGGRVAVLDDVNPKSANELYRLLSQPEDKPGTEVEPIPLVSKSS